MIRFSIQTRIESESFWNGAQLRFQNAGGEVITESTCVDSRSTGTLRFASSIPEDLRSQIVTYEIALEWRPLFWRHD